MAEVGDKYIVEIEDKVFINKMYYVLKDFPGILMTENDLDILEKYEPVEEAGPAPVSIGDEVEDESGARWFVTFVKRTNGNVFSVAGIGLDGCFHSTSTVAVKRTGHYNKHIVEALNWRTPLDWL